MSGKVRQSRGDIRLGHFLSKVLRHEPQAAGIEVDRHGWADVEELMEGVRRTGQQIDRETLERIVRENNKQRYSFNEDGTKIRANQGHSIPVDLEMPEAEPPRFLYHGTAEDSLPGIRAEGIRKMKRQYIHLSGNYQTAVEVGRRHGRPAVITIDAEAMARDGIELLISQNGVWQCDYVPVKYFVSDETAGGGYTK